MQSKSISQYDIFNRGKCPGPRAGAAAMANADCSSPKVFRTGSDPLAPASAFTFQTLPNMYREAVAGGHVTYRRSPRTYVGVTGFGSGTTFLTKGIDLDFQDGSSMPYGGPFGGVGADLGIGLGHTNLFAEVAQTFDSERGGGGLAGIARTVTHWGDGHELEASARYYDPDFANPYSRSIAQSDEASGNRARDEAGMKVRYSGKPFDGWTFRSSVDLWAAPSTLTTHAAVFGRADYQISRHVSTGTWLSYQNKDLNQNGRGECFETSFTEDEFGEPLPCAGQKTLLSVRLEVQPSPLWYTTLTFQNSWVDEAATMDQPELDHEFRQDFVSAIAIGWAPLRTVSFRARSRYRSENRQSSRFRDQSLTSYADIVWTPRAADRVRLRYDVEAYFPNQMEMSDPSPPVDHGLWFEYESRF
jgi:hypothetical protein